MRGFELGTETDRMFADAEQKRAEREVGKTEFQQVVDASGTKPMTPQQMLYTSASVAPISGDIIAYKEAPEDFERAYELMQRGYKEKDLVNLGLGAAFAGLVTLGLVPGIGFVSRISKNAAKDSIKDLLKEGNLDKAADTMVKTSKVFNDKALTNKKAEKQLKELARARIKFNNMTGKKTSDVDLLHAELPKEKLSNIDSQEYSNIINDLSKDMEVKKYLSNKYDNADDSIEVAFPENFRPKNEIAAMTSKREPSPVMQRKKSKLRTLVDALPESEKALLPKQADDFSVAGYHGTSVSRDSDKPFFDISFGRNQDEFLGEGFYFTLDPKVASEYANLRAINQLVDAGKRGGEGLSIYKPTGQKVTTSTLLKGVDIDGQAIPVGQQVAKFDLSNLEKPYVVKTLKDRIYLKENFQKVKDEGYDSVLFDNFKDRSKQIMVFPEHIGKIDEGSGAIKQGSTSSERYMPKEASPLEIGTSKFAVEGKLKSNYTTETIKLFDDKLKNIKTAGSPKADELIGTPVKDGTKVGIRKNLNSSTVDGEKGVLQTIHTNNYNGKALSYQPYATVENVTFNVNQKHRQRIASKAKGLAVPEASGKFNMASVDGNYVSNRNLLSEGYDTEISFNPALGHLYTDVTTGQAVKSADTATVIGNRVFANGVTYWKKADAPKPIDASDGTKLTGEVRYKFNRGGLMARA